MDEKMQRARMSGTRYKNLLLQGRRKAHVGAAVRKLRCGVEAEGEKGETVHDGGVWVSESPGLVHSTRGVDKDGQQLLWGGGSGIVEEGMQWLEVPAGQGFI
jgi:hypothetical protein